MGVFVAVSIMLLALSARLLQDPDSHWHVAVGRWIWGRGTVPWTDPFSHTFAGAPWVAKEWLSQLLFFGAYEAAGWRGVVLAAVLTIAGTMAVLFRWLESRLQRTTALVIVLLVVMLSAGSWMARPHVFSFATLLLWTIALTTAAERRTSPPWWALAVMVLWVNLHGSFTIGFALAGLLALHALILAEPDERWPLALRWAGFLALAVLAAFATPYGYRAMLVTVTMFDSGESLPYITEWQPLALDASGVVAIAALIAAVVVLLRRPKENVALLLVVALFGMMMIRHTRFVPLFALVAAVVVTGPLARLAPRLGAAPMEGDAARAPRRWVAALLLLPFALSPFTNPAPSPGTTPARALAAARAAGLDGRVYNDYDFGGYLIEQGVPTFIDGRTDQLFLGGFITETKQAAAASGHERFAHLLDRHHVDWALVAARSSEARHLDALPRWRRLYADSIAAVYARQ